MESLILRKLIIKGYNVHCDQIERLVSDRLNTDMLELYEVLLSDRKDDIKRYCADNNIDLLDINEQAKRNIALNIIEIEIKTLLKEKGKYDSELKKLSIKTRKILNGIQDSPWFKLFNSPRSLQWWTKNTEKVLMKCDVNHKHYNWVDSKIELIKEVWVQIDPQEALPDIKTYWQVYKFDVPEQVREYLTFLSGN